MQVFSHDSLLRCFVTFCSTKDLSLHIKLINKHFNNWLCDNKNSKLIKELTINEFNPLFAVTFESNQSLMAQLYQFHFDWFVWEKQFAQKEIQNRKIAHLDVLNKFGKFKIWLHLFRNVKENFVTLICNLKFGYTYL